MQERSQNEKADKKGISKNGRLHGGLSGGAADTAGLRKYESNHGKKTAKHHLYYDGRPRLTRPELLRKQDQPDAKPRPACQRWYALR